MTGATIANFVRSNIYSKRDELLSPEDLASTVVHELLHTARVEHPFEYTQAKDLKLVSTEGNSFISTENTDKNIIYNIMIYDVININGVNRGELFKREGYSKENLTTGQVDFLLKQIDLMTKGAGAKGLSDPFYFDPVGEKVKKN